METAKIEEYIKFLQANEGDSIRIRYKGNDNKFHNIFIDMGPEDAYEDSVKDEINSFEDGEVIDLLIVSHYDNDHIEGVIEFMEDKNTDLSIIKQCWLNFGDVLEIKRVDSRKIGINEAKSLNTLLDNNNIKRNTIPIKALDIFEDDLFGAKITVLSPDLTGLDYLREKVSNKLSNDYIAKTDYKLSIEDLAENPDNVYPPSHHQNRSANINSIAFLFEYKNTKAIFLADSHPPVIVESLKRLPHIYFNDKGKIKLDYMQVSHHGSKKNTTYELLSLIDCQDFIISTDGSDTKNKLPNKETLARIIDPLNKNRKDFSETITFHFNHDNSTLKEIFIEEQKAKEYNFKCEFHTMGCILPIKSL